MTCEELPFVEDVQVLTDQGQSFYLVALLKFFNDLLGHRQMRRNPVAVRKVVFVTEQMRVGYEAANVRPVSSKPQQNFTNSLLTVKERNGSIGCRSDRVWACATCSGVIHSGCLILRVKTNIESIQLHSLHTFWEK